MEGVQEVGESTQQQQQQRAQRTAASSSINELDSLGLGVRSDNEQRFSSRLGPLRKSISWPN